MSSSIQDLIFLSGSFLLSPRGDCHQWICSLPEPHNLTSSLRFASALVCHHVRNWIISFFISLLWSGPVDKCSFLLWCGKETVACNPPCVSTESSAPCPHVHCLTCVVAADGFFAPAGPDSVPFSSRSFSPCSLTHCHTTLFISCLPFTNPCHDDLSVGTSSRPKPPERCLPSLDALHTYLCLPFISKHCASSLVILVTLVSLHWDWASCFLSLFSRVAWAFLRTLIIAQQMWNEWGGEQQGSVHTCPWKWGGRGNHGPSLSLVLQLHLESVQVCFPAMSPHSIAGIKMCTMTQP